MGSARIVKTEIGWWGRKIQPVTVSAGVNASNSPKPQRWLMRLELHRAGVHLQPYALKRPSYHRHTSPGEGPVYLQNYNPLGNVTVSTIAAAIPATVLF